MSDVSETVSARTTIRFDAEHRKGIAAYMVANGFTQSQAIRTLIEVGLAREGAVDQARSRAAVREGFNAGLRKVKEALATALGNEELDGLEMR